MRTMNKASRVTLALSDAGLVNKKNLCIKDMGSTLGCVCESCLKEFQSKLRELLKELDEPKDN